jgi:hypothetical protein
MNALLPRSFVRSHGARVTRHSGARQEFVRKLEGVAHSMNPSCIRRRNALAAVSFETLQAVAAVLALRPIEPLLAPWKRASIST